MGGPEVLAAYVYRETQRVNEEIDMWGKDVCVWGGVVVGGGIPSFFWLELKTIILVLGL